MFYKLPLVSIRLSQQLLEATQPADFLRLFMTIVAMIVSILLGTLSLSYGYSAAGMTQPARWFAFLGIIWILAHWRKVYWASSAAFVLVLIGAAYGVWYQFTTIWMLLGALGGLLGWDLSDFARRLSYAAPTDNIQALERLHLERAGIVAALGFGIAILSLVIHINRLPFEVAVGLVLIAALGLTRLVLRLRRY